MTLPVVSVNGERLSPTGHHVSAYDRGFTLADGLFETMRAHRGELLRVDQHLARMATGLKVLDIPVPSHMRTWLLEALRAAGPVDASVRLTVTRGLTAGGVGVPGASQPTVVVTVNPLPVFPSAIYQSGLSVHIATGRRNEHAVTVGLKTLAYTDAVVALADAQRHGADDALFLDTEGHCSEATSSNLFVWTGHVLITPPASCGALPGITRAIVGELAATLRLQQVEQIVSLDDVLGADEAFLTSSLRGIAPLVRVDSRPVGPGSPGTVTGELASAYAALVSRECGTEADAASRVPRT